MRGELDVTAMLWNDAPAATPWIRGIDTGGGRCLTWRRRVTGALVRRPCAVTGPALARALAPSGW
jgi:hypothetical protein